MTAVEQTSLNFVSSDALEVIPGALRRDAHTTIVASLDDLARALEAHIPHPMLGTRPPIDLDLVGHSTRGHHLLRIGAIAVDALDLGVRRFFEQLAGRGLLASMNVASVRILGCETARSPSGLRTLRSLAAILRVPVYGTARRISRLHFTAQSFDPCFRSILRVVWPPGARALGGGERLAPSWCPMNPLPRCGPQPRYR